jgi:hypothetical protein
MLLAKGGWEMLSKHTSQQPLFGKGSSGVRFQIFLEFKCLEFVRERAIPNQLSGLELRGVRGPAGIVVGYPLLQISGCAGVFLFWKSDAADDVDVPHDRSRVAEGSCGGFSPSSPFGLCRARFA